MTVTSSPGLIRVKVDDLEVRIRVEVVQGKTKRYYVPTLPVDEHALGLVAAALQATNLIGEAA